MSRHVLRQLPITPVTDDLAETVSQDLESFAK